LDIGETTYVGVDIVVDLIDANRRRYGSYRRAFLEMDIIRRIIPEVDLVLCRECLLHLSFADIRATISNFKASGSTYLLTTHYPKLDRNINVITGGCRGLNWSLTPFHFPEPIATLSEDVSDRCLALWRLDDIHSESIGY
jgi:hypothetical protein